MEKRHRTAKGLLWSFDAVCLALPAAAMVLISLGATLDSDLLFELSLWSFQALSFAAPFLFALCLPVAYAAFRMKEPGAAAFALMCFVLYGLSFAVGLAGRLGPFPVPY
jgi:hypothetical protein